MSRQKLHHISEDPYLLSLWDFENNSLDVKEVTVGSSLEAYWLCIPWKHSYKRRINNQRKRSACPTCETPKTEEEWNYYFSSKFGFDKQWLLDNYINSTNSLDELWRAGGPGHGLLRRALKAFNLEKPRKTSMAQREEKRIATWIEKYGEFKPQKFCSSPSSQELEIGEILKKNKIEYISGDVTLIAPKELDFYLPELHLAIEFNGLYWHDKPGYEKDLVEQTAFSRERIKEIECEKLGVKLVHIWEDDYFQEKDKEALILGIIALTKF